MRIAITRNLWIALVLAVLVLASCAELDGETVYVGPDSEIPTGEYRGVVVNGTEISVNIAQMPSQEPQATYTAFPTYTPYPTYTPPPQTPAESPSPTPEEFTPAPDPTATETPHPDPTATSTPEPTYTPTDEPTATPTPGGPTASPTPVGRCIGTVINQAGLNVRADHDPNASVLVTLAYGQAVYIQAVYVIESLTTEWAQIQVRAGNTEGWVAAYYYGGARLLEWEDGAVECLPPHVEFYGPGYGDTPTPTPTSTPGASPTPTATATPITCSVYTATDAPNLNVRDLPSTVEGSVIAEFPGGARTVALAQYTGQGFIWYRINWFGEVGWIADGEVLQTEGNCGALPPEDPMGDRPSLVIGFHTTPSASLQAALNALQILDEAGLAFGLKPYFSLNFCSAVIDAGGYCVYRHGAPDCPRRDLSPQDSAADFIQHDQQAATLFRGVDRFYLEPLNECWGDPMPQSEYDWWIAFSHAYLDLAEARDFPPVLLWGIPPGNFNRESAVQFESVIRRLVALGGGISMHDYTFHFRSEGLCDGDKWEAYRHRLITEYMRLEGYSAPIFVTEAARGTGNSPPDIADFTCWVQSVAENDPNVVMVALWNFGPHPRWRTADLTPVADALMRSIVGALQ